MFHDRVDFENELRLDQMLFGIVISLYITSKASVTRRAARMTASTRFGVLKYRPCLFKLLRFP
jgi:hypothetical protein